jgi:hypothetical protein
MNNHARLFNSMDEYQETIKRSHVHPEHQPRPPSVIAPRFAMLSLNSIPLAVQANLDHGQDQSILMRF